MNNERYEYDSKEFKSSDGETMDDEEYKARVKELYYKSNSYKKKILETKAELKSNETLIKALKNINDKFKN